MKVKDRILIPIVLALYIGLWIFRHGCEGGYSYMAKNCFIGDNAFRDCPFDGRGHNCSGNDD